MAQQTALSVMALPGVVHSFIAKASAGIDWAFKGAMGPYDRVATETIVCDFYLQATAGTAYARLYDVTDGAAVADSQVSTASADLVLLTTGTIVLVNDHNYRAQFGREGADDFGAVGAVVYAIL